MLSYAVDSKHFYEGQLLHVISYVVLIGISFSLVNWSYLIIDT
jgi:hypothetical protein